MHLSLPDLPYYTFEEAAELLECTVADLEHLVFIERKVRPAIPAGKHNEFCQKPDAVSASIERGEDYFEELWHVDFPPLPICYHIWFDQIENQRINPDGSTSPTHSCKVSRRDTFNISQFEDDLGHGVSFAREGESYEPHYLTLEGTSLVISHFELSSLSNPTTESSSGTQGQETITSKRIGNLRRICGALATALKYTDDEFMDQNRNLDSDGLAASLEPLLKKHCKLSKDQLLGELRASLFLVSEPKKKERDASPQ